MQSYKYGISMAALSCQGEIEQLVKGTLHTDWAIFIEYGEFSESKSTTWHRWGKAHFDVQSAEPVIDAILACRSCYPNFHIRLYAEKLRPSTKLVYCVHKPTENFPGERAYLTDQALSPYVNKSAEKQIKYSVQSK